MSRIDDLIQELCPDGVPSVELGALFTIQYGRDVRASEISLDPTEERSVPCYGANGLRGYTSSTISRERALLVGVRGTIGSIYLVEPPFFVNGNSVFLLPRIEVSLDYFLHALKHLSLSRFSLGGTVPLLTIKRLERILIPLPDLEIQQEIVRVLDQFTQLEAELEARKKQYAYYRDQLLSFSEVSDGTHTPWLVLAV